LLLLVGGGWRLASVVRNEAAVLGADVMRFALLLRRGAQAIAVSGSASRGAVRVPV